MVNELGTVIFIVYIYYMLAIRYKLELINNIECIKKEDAIRRMGELEDFIGCMIKRDLTKTNLNIYQLDIINRMTQGFNKYVKSLMTFNTLDTPPKGICI